MVDITYIGHASFLFENDKNIVITDPWLTPGTFDKSWFQYPRNEHMIEIVLNKINDNTSKNIFIYISHEHLDHFDEEFLNSIDNRNICFVFPKFKRTYLEKWFDSYKCKTKYILLDQEEIIIDESLKFTLFVEDCELNRDSGILIKMDEFVIYNGNDCKYDKIELITKYGDIDIFCQQFSGATWHPICYDYSEKDYNDITEKKRASKRKLILRYIEKLNVKMYIPCAGPPVLLDPELIQISKKEFTIFPRANWIKDILTKETPNVICEIFMPGDIFNINNYKFIELNKNRVDDYNYAEYLNYLEQYQNDYKQLFEERAIENAKINDEEVFFKLTKVIQDKLDIIKHLKFKEIFPTYIKLSNFNKYIRINFNEKKIEVVDKILESYKVYVLETYGWQINKVLTGLLSWDSFHLSLRSKLYRKPDEFQTMLNAFIFHENEDLERTFKYMISLTDSKEKIKIKTPNGEYYEMCKKCPHQGQDLEIAEIEDSHIVICPKHCWKFDLHNEGKCLTNNDTLQSKKIQFNPNDKYISLKTVQRDIEFNINEYETVIDEQNNYVIRILLKCKDEDEITLNDEIHYINLKIDNVIRPYTFTNDIINNKTTSFELYIKLYDNGEMSQLLREQSKNSKVHATIGTSTVENSLIQKNKHINILAGGTGITPFIRLIKNNSNITFNVIYFNNPGCTALLSDFLNECKNTKVFYKYGIAKYDEISVHLTKPYLNLICGPPRMISYYKDLLVSNGINEDKIKCYD